MVAMGFINSTFKGSIGSIEIVFLNIGMITFLYILERSIFSQRLIKQKIKYEKLDLLKVGNRTLLRKDLEDRIGAQVIDVKVESVNYLEGSANIVVRYNRDKTEISHRYVFPNPSEHRKAKEEKFLVKGL